MRVIGGIYGGRRLRTAEGLKVRPTSDRLREALFNILAPQIEDARFLDICAGSGAVGIEALSRGASHAAFIDHSRRACSVIEDNLESLGIADQTNIINREATAALARLIGESREFDIIFFDPPYASKTYLQVMKLLGTGPLLVSNGMVIVEHRAKMPPEAEYGELRVYREVKQGESALAFYARV